MIVNDIGPNRYFNLLRTFPKILLLFSCFCLPDEIVSVFAGVEEVAVLFDPVAVSFVATLESPLERGVEGLALNPSNFKLKSGGLPAAIGGSIAACSPGRATVDLGQIGELLESTGIAKGNEDHAMMDEGRHDAKVGALLTTTCTSSRNKGAHEFPGEGTSLPELSGGIPESLELCWPRAITSADTNEEAVVLRELGGGNNGVVGFSRGIHLGEDLLRESLRNLEDGGRPPCGLDALLDGFRQPTNVAVHRVDNNGDLGSGHSRRLFGRGS